MTITDVSPKPEAPTVYIGDGVYASYDGYQIWLRTGDGNNQQIALEPSVFNALVAYESMLRKRGY